MFKALSPAKINLFLNVVGKRDDGYHLLESLFIPLPRLYDEVSVGRAGELSCELDYSQEIRDNIVLKVANELRLKYGISQGAKIKIKKNIPVAAGLGGGSSNAATAHKLLCRLWGIPYSREEAIDFLVRIGADVPFFVVCEPAFVEGIGERIYPMQLNQRFSLILVNPKVLVSTATVFRMGFKEFTASLNKPSPKILVEGIFSGKNDLEPNALVLAPQIQEVLHYLKSMPGCKVARMSGAGATCFGIFQDNQSAQKAIKNLPSHWWSHYEEVAL